MNFLYGSICVYIILSHAIPIQVQSLPEVSAVYVVIIDVYENASFPW